MVWQNAWKSESAFLCKSVYIKVCTKMYVTPLPFQQYFPLTESCISLAVGLKEYIDYHLSVRSIKWVWSFQEKLLALFFVGAKA